MPNKKLVIEATEYYEDLVSSDFNIDVDYNQPPLFDSVDDDDEENSNNNHNNNNSSSSNNDNSSNSNNNDNSSNSSSNKTKRSCRILELRCGDLFKFHKEIVKADILIFMTDVIVSKNRYLLCLFLFL